MMKRKMKKRRREETNDGSGTGTGMGRGRGRGRRIFDEPPSCLLEETLVPASPSPITARGDFVPPSAFPPPTPSPHYASFNILTRLSPAGRSRGEGGGEAPLFNLTFLILPPFSPPPRARNRLTGEPLADLRDPAILSSGRPGPRDDSFALCVFASRHPRAS